MILSFIEKDLTECLDFDCWSTPNQIGDYTIINKCMTFSIGYTFLNLISFSHDDIIKIDNKYKNTSKAGTRLSSIDVRKAIYDFQEINPFLSLSPEIIYDIIVKDRVMDAKGLFKKISIFREYIDLAISDSTFFDYRMLMLACEKEFMPQIPTELRRCLTDNDAKDIEFFDINDLKGIKIDSVTYVSSYDTSVSIDPIIDACAASLFEILRHGLIIKKCKNCGKYFIPFNRSDTMFCDRDAPQDNSKTCKEYNSQRLYYEKIKANEVRSLQRRIYQQKQILTKRNPDIKKYRNDFEQFKINSKQWKTDVKKGAKTETEFFEWLNAVKEKKV